jgi:hypothetical protein
VDRHWIRLAVASLVATPTAAISLVFVAAGDVERPKVAARATVQVPCHEALLADWSDGRIDGTYPVRCYRAALDALPADLEVYSSAADDIAHALSKRIVQSTGTRRPAR